MGASRHDASVSDPPLTDPGLGYERVFEAGERIYGPGDPPGGLFVIHRGEVDLLRPGSGDPELFPPLRLGRGDLFGEASVLLGIPYREHAVAAVPTQLLELDVATVQALCLERPEVAIRLIRTLASRAVSLEDRLEAMGLAEILPPLVRFLLERARSAADDPPRVATSLRELSAETGLSMAEAYRALRRLLERRLVRLADEVVWIPDLDSLASCRAEPPSR